MKQSGPSGMLVSLGGRLSQRDVFSLFLMFAIDVAECTDSRKLLHKVRYLLRYLLFPIKRNSVPQLNPLASASQIRFKSVKCLPGNPRPLIKSVQENSMDNGMKGTRKFE